MKKFAKLFAIMTMVVVVTLMSVNSVSFGYFFAENKQIVDGGKVEFVEKSKDPNIRKVGSAAELFMATKDVEYNSGAQASNSKNRYTILLTANITLPTSIAVTADCNIDLGGFTLNLNGNTMAFEHTYHGSILVYNGNISGDIGAAIRINTCNAIVDLSGAEVENSVTVDVASASADEVFNQAFAMVGSRLSGGNATNVVLPTDNVNRECARHAGNNQSCAYLCEDVDLPTNLYGYDVAFDYVSDNTTALSSGGKVTGAVGNIVDLALNLTLKYGEETRNKSFRVHVYSKEDTDAKEQIALIAAADTLEKYHFEGVLTEGGQSVSLYKLYQSTYLPRYMLGVELDYITVTADGVERDNTQNIVGNNFKIVDVGGYAINLDEHVVTLTVATKSGKTLDLAVNGSDVSSVVDNYTIALKIANELYGEEILVKKEVGHNGYTKVAIQDDMSAYADKGVVSVEYLMSYDIDKTYRIGALQGENGKYLYVAGAINPPTILQKSGVRMRFSFATEPTIVSLTVPIRYVDDEQTEGDMLAKFWPYYNYFDRMFTVNSGKYGMNTFTMPFNYNDKVVYYYEALSGGLPTDIVTSTLEYYIAADKKTATLQDVKAMTPSQLTDIVETNKAKWIITFDAYKLRLEDIDLQFKYMYKFSDFTTAWHGQETDAYISLHTAPGIIKDKSVSGLKDYIIDTKLYAYVYNHSKPVNLGNYSANSGQYIYTLWLNEDFAEINNANNAIGISNYDGLQLLTHVRKLNLNGAFKPTSTINQSITQYIAGMTSLVELDLSNNGNNFSDRKVGMLNLPSGGNNGAIRQLSTLTKLEKLHLEGNYIYYFNDLKYIPNLKEVCVYNNVITISLLDINTLFGTKGVVNYSIFTSLTGKGVKVNNTAEGSGYQGGADSNKVIDAISSLVYQKVIPKGGDISQAYVGLSTKWQDYLTEKMTKSVKGWWGETKDADDELKFTNDGEANSTNSFRLEYKYFYFVPKFLFFDSYEIVIDFEFDVIRV